MFYIISISLLAILDQIIKYLTTSMLCEGESFVVIDNVLNFTHVHNTGGPWSMLNDEPWIFILMTIVIFVIGCFYFIKNKPSHLSEKISVALIGGGAVGNFADRIIRGYVVDMIDIRFIDYPVFNPADCFIVIGAVLMCIYVLFIYKDKPKEDM